MQPTPDRKTGFTAPLLLNTVVVLLIAALAYASNSQRNEALLTLALSVVALAGANFLALIIAAVVGKTNWVTGFAVSVALLLLIGLGSCGLMGIV